jgi:hypothetical protein
MKNVIEITKAFPATRERTVLLELLNTVRLLREKSVEVIVCGGWVPFLKDLAERTTSEHKMSLDIDVLFPEGSRSPEKIDIVRETLLKDLSFHISNTSSSKLEKRIGADLVELDLLADLPRGKDDDGVVKIYGETTSLDLAFLDGGNNLLPHTEEITINNQKEDGTVQATTLTIPDPVGFLMLKAEVTKFRQKDKDPYDIYYYCTKCENPVSIREKLQQVLTLPGVQETIRRLQYIFRYPDSHWVISILDEQRAQEGERDREAQRIVRAMARMLDGLT